MPTKDFQRFIDTFFGSGVEAARQGPAVDALERLEGGERVQAEQLLLTRLSDDDSRPALGLGVLRSQVASERIAALMRKAKGTERAVNAEFLINVSAARYRIAGDPEALANIANVLAESPFESIRVSAAVALRAFPVPEAEAALLRAVEGDESGVVRHNAAKSLLRLHGLLPDERQSPPISIRVMVQVPHMRQEALRELQELLKQHPMAAQAP